MQADLQKIQPFVFGMNFMEPIYLKIAAEKWYVCDTTLFIFNWKLKKRMLSERKKTLRENSALE